MGEIAFGGDGDMRMRVVVGKKKADDSMCTSSKKENVGGVGNGSV